MRQPSHDRGSDPEGIRGDHKCREEAEESIALALALCKQQHRFQNQPKERINGNADNDGIADSKDSVRGALVIEQDELVGNDPCDPGGGQAHDEGGDRRGQEDGFKEPEEQLRGKGNEQRRTNTDSQVSGEEDGGGNR